MGIPTQNNDAAKLAEHYEHCRKFAMEHNISVVTATQPYRGGPGPSPEELEEIGKRPIVIDYIGIM